MPEARGRHSPSKLSRRLDDVAPSTIMFAAILILLIVYSALLNQGRFVILPETAILFAGVLRFRRGPGYRNVIKAIQTIAIKINKGKVLGPRVPDQYPVTFTGVVVPEHNNLLGTMVDDRFDHIAIQANGARFVAGSAYELEMALEATAEAYKLWDAATPLSVGVTPIDRFRPWTDRERKIFMALNVQPEILDAFNYIEIPDDELSTDEQRWKRKAIYLLQRRDINRLYARRTTQAYVISAKRPVIWGSSLRNNSFVSESDIKRSAIVTLAGLVVESLENLGVVEPRFLGLSGIHDFFAEGWAVGADYVAYQRRKESGIIPLKDADMVENRKITKASAFWFKESPTVGKDWICFDGKNYHRVFQLINISSILRANTLSHLKRLNITGSMATVGSTMSSGREGSNIAREIAIRKQYQMMRGQKVYDRHEETARIEELKRQDTARYESGNTAMSYNTYLAIGAGTIKELDDAQIVLERKVRKVTGAKVIVVEGESFQEDAFITAVLGVNRL